MRTFYVHTLGCKVNHYETEQIASLFRSRGLVQVRQPDAADVCLVNTCSVTIQAASKSRQSVRQLLRRLLWSGGGSEEGRGGFSSRQRVIVTGCWATSDSAEVSRIPGVTAVLGHRDHLAARLDELLASWRNEDQTAPVDTRNTRQTAHMLSPPESLGNDGSMMQAGTPVQQHTEDNKAQWEGKVKGNPAEEDDVTGVLHSREGTGAETLPLLDSRQSGQQRAFLKIQDGCDAHCTYCIIPSLRPALWSKPLEEAVGETRRLVEAGHREVVLTGIFLGAYGQCSAVRRRQRTLPGRPLAELIDAICGKVGGLRRLRLSSLEPGDLSDELLGCLRAHGQVVPHFHLPLQSGSDALLRRMNRQYRRDDYLGMVHRLRAAFDRPALTTDVIVGFPGENERRFEETLEVVKEAGFIQIHTFPFSPRPGTAAARWRGELVSGAVVNERIRALRQCALEASIAFREQFVGQTVEVIVELPNAGDRLEGEERFYQHGRCERYFPVHFRASESLAGECVRVRVERVTAQRTYGVLVSEVSGGECGGGRGGLT